MRAGMPRYFRIPTLTRRSAPPSPGGPGGEGPRLQQFSASVGGEKTRESPTVMPEENGVVALGYDPIFLMPSARMRL